MKALLTLLICYVWLAAIGCNINSIIRTQVHGLTIILEQAKQATGVK